MYADIQHFVSEPTLHPMYVMQCKVHLYSATLQQSRHDGACVSAVTYKHEELSKQIIMPYRIDKSG